MNAPVWLPANEIEHRLSEAVTARDIDAALRITVTAPLVLPAFHATAAGERLATRPRDGVTYLLVFTSVAAMNRTVDADGWRPTSVTDLMVVWERLTGGQPWGLAINAGTPISLLVPPQDVPTLVPTPDRLTSFTPANEVEQVLRDGLAAPDAVAVLDALVTARVWVPRRALMVGPVPTVAVFTSAGLCAGYLTRVGINTATVTLDFVALLQQWPGADYPLAVNPGSPIEFCLPGAAVTSLLAHAVGLVGRRLNPPAGADVAAAPAGHITDVLRGG
jgi:hypothetical protein